MKEKSNGISISATENEHAQWNLKSIYSRNISLPSSTAGRVLMVALGVIGWLLWQPQVQNIFASLSSADISYFYLGESIDGSNINNRVFEILIYLAIIKVLWGALIGLSDLMLYEKITGRKFDTAGMINMAIVNSIIIFVGVFSYSAINLDTLSAYYNNVLDYVPTIVDVGGPAAVLIALLLGDFCFYWAHRAVHNVRILWNLGHIYHHRNQHLTQLTHGVEPRFLLLNAEGIGGLFLVPVIAKLFSIDLDGAEYILIPLAIINIWVDPSHSVFLYNLELKYKLARSIRYVFVTAGVHYTHHSKDATHNIKTGCNFSARFTFWDRLFGTYVEPSNYIPETGLFSNKTDYCLNPLRFLILPYLRFFDEFRKNKLRYWPKILFGTVFWSPPNKSKLSH